MINNRDFESEEEVTIRAVNLSKVIFYEFNCPNCDANNPMNDGFKSGDEVICLYCGLEFKVKTVSENNFQLIPI